MKERIQKVLANAGVDSRRNVERMVLDGRVTVNGKTLRTLPILVDPERDKISVDGEPIRLVEKKRGRAAAPNRRPHADQTPGGPRIYFLLNKPKGVYSTNVAQGTQVRVLDLLPEDLPGRVYPVGRLDVETKGLLLMTNDGELTNRLTHPRYGISKTYRATVDGAVAPLVIQEMEKGVWITDPRTGKSARSAKAQVKVVKRLRERSVLDITVREGRNLHIRRVLTSLGHKVRELTRTSMGPLTLDNLKPGQFRPLTPKEVKLLQKATEKPPEAHRPQAMEKAPAEVAARADDYDEDENLSEE